MGVGTTMSLDAIDVNNEVLGEVGKDGQSCHTIALVRPNLIVKVVSSCRSSHCEVLILEKLSQVRRQRPMNWDRNAQTWLRKDLEMSW